jgi:acyl-CoA synthetase (AMP-forming)/AMP-acid ligase II
MIQKWGVTILATTPSLLQAFLTIAPAEKLTSLRMIVVGAEKTPAALRRRVEALGIPLVEGYGITECSPLLTLTDPGKSEGVGRPLPSVEIKILDLETKEPLPVRSKGIIVAQGATVFDGYLGTQVDPFLDFDRKKWYSQEILDICRKTALWFWKGASAGR